MIANIPSDDPELSVVDPRASPAEQHEISDLLKRCGLNYEDGVEVFVICRIGNRLIACAGLETDIVKCVAIDPEFRGNSLTLTLVSEIVNLALERGHAHLFLYTRPENASFFARCGFYSLAEVPGYVTLMENTPVGIKGYCQKLQKKRRPGEKIGAIVMNANPFTLGHRYLAEFAAAQCDWLHVFVVSEDASFITYADRYALVEAGLRDIPRMTLHHGSEYIVSRATFPCYFFKEEGIVGDCCTAVDLLLFRNYIAPALGVTHRFVGTEPFCPTTRKYNEDMMFWLQSAPEPGPSITVVEQPRSAYNGVPISASEVRLRLRAGDFDGIRPLVPGATCELLRVKYAKKAARAPSGHLSQGPDNDPVAAST